MAITPFSWEKAEPAGWVVGVEPGEVGERHPPFVDPEVQHERQLPGEGDDARLLGPDVATGLLKRHVVGAECVDRPV